MKTKMTIYYMMINGKSCKFNNDLNSLIVLSRDDAVELDRVIPEDVFEISEELRAGRAFERTIKVSIIAKELELTEVPVKLNWAVFDEHGHWIWQCPNCLRWSSEDYYKGEFGTLLFSCRCTDLHPAFMGIPSSEDQKYLQPKSN